MLMRRDWAVLIVKLDDMQKEIEKKKEALLTIDDIDRFIKNRVTGLDFKELDLDLIKSDVGLYDLDVIQDIVSGLPIMDVKEAVKDLEPGVNWYTIASNNVTYEPVKWVQVGNYLEQIMYRIIKNLI